VELRDAQKAFGPRAHALAQKVDAAKAALAEIAVAVAGATALERREEAAEAAEAAEASEAAAKPGVELHRPYFVAFEEADAMKALNCPSDELHSALAHFAYRAKEHVTLFSKFPTKLKLRFFGRTEVSDLAQRIKLLGKVLPLAKKCNGVYTIETAKALAELGGQPGQLSNALWQAGGNEFKVEKADYGYMVLVKRQVGEAQIQEWAEEISSINSRARENSIEKLDAAFIALTRAAEAATKPPAAEEACEEKADRGQLVHKALNELIDAYFATTVDPSAVVAGDPEERKRRLHQALGEEYRARQERPQPWRPSGPGGPTGASAPSAGAASGGEPAMPAEERKAIERDAVFSVTARLVMSPDWPDLPSDEPAAVAHTAAQFLAGIGSMVMPAAKWRDHRCWGACRNFGEFDLLEELVLSALERIRTLKSSRRAAQAAQAMPSK